MVTVGHSQPIDVPLRVREMRKSNVATRHPGKVPARVRCKYAHLVTVLSSPKAHSAIYVCPDGFKLSEARRAGPRPTDRVQEGVGSIAPARRLIGNRVGVCPSLPLTASVVRRPSCGKTEMDIRITCNGRKRGIAMLKGDCHLESGFMELSFALVRRGGEAVCSSVLTDRRPGGMQIHAA